MRRVEIEVAIAAVLVAFWPRFNLFVRALLTGLFGFAALIAGLFGHLAHFVSGGAGGSDYTGILFTVGGAILVVLFVLLIVRRRELSGTP